MTSTIPAEPSAFFRLSSASQQAIAHKLGWRSLRPVQEHSIPPVLEGCNCLILAPTAGGKTESAFLPALDLAYLAKPTAPYVLYLSPLKALLNNQQARIERLSGNLGLDVFLWHGDISGGAKKKFLANPAPVLMTTPESLEVMLIASGPAALEQRHRLLAQLSIVIIDEIHAFVGDDRGDHLICLMERLSDASGRDIQRIGLSATVGKPEVLLNWLSGGSQRPQRLVDPGKQKSKRRIQIHPHPPEPSKKRAKEGTAAEEEHKNTSLNITAVELIHGKKALLFADSRSLTEGYHTSLTQQGILSYVHHSAISVETRLQAEEAFQNASECCIVCTSTMELGLDVGDLDLVVQHQSPATVSSFLQRLGRTGRREGSVGHFAFLTDDRWNFLQACAVIELTQQGWVEPANPSLRNPILFLQQSLARIFGAGGMTKAELLEGIGQPCCWSKLERESRSDILEHLLGLEVLIESDCLLQLGPTAEKTLGKHHFVDLYSVFETFPSYSIVDGQERKIGQLDSFFVSSLKVGSCFSLGGRGWKVELIFPGAKQIKVQHWPAAAKAATWIGTPRILGFELCQAIRGVLTNPVPPYLKNRAVDTLTELQNEYATTLSGADWVLQSSEQGMRLWTFAGLRVNNTLNKLFQLSQQAEDGGEPIQSSCDNFCVRFDLPDEGTTLVSDLIQDLKSGLFEGPEWSSKLAATLSHQQSGKFSQWLPQNLKEELLIRRYLDPAKARKLASGSLKIARSN